MILFPDARILDIDLTMKEIKTRRLPGEVYRQYPGGSTLGLYLILQEMKPVIEPLSPENMLILSVSPLTGLPISGQSRICVTTKSPLTGTIGDSQAGGFLAAHLKANGYDSVIIRGSAEKPVYIDVDGEDVQIKDASAYWGRMTGEVEKALKEELQDPDIEIAQIGPAGEKLVRFSSIIHHCSRANGRNGVGAVMGSKNLKALAVHKKSMQKPVDEDAFSRLTKDVMQRIRSNPTIEALGKYGTDVDLLAFSETGFLPTGNYASGYFPDGASKITGTAMAETILKKRESCHRCAIACKRVVEVHGVVDPLYGGPEYETCAAFGSYCRIDDIEVIAQANQLCNMYGLDTISCGAVAAFAMECFEKGIIKPEETDGLNLSFGDGDALLKLIHRIALREGIGNLLAEGCSRAAAVLRNGAEKLSVAVKGQELPAHMPQFKPAVGLIYAVNAFGADHQSSEHDVFLLMPADSPERRRLSQIGAYRGYDSPHVLDEDKVRFAYDTQCFYSMLDTLCLCQFAWGPAWQLYGPTDIVDMARYGIGWETSLFELMRIGERRINMMRFFNAREGFTKEDDVLPERIFDPLPDGPSKGQYLDRDAFLKAKALYYQIAGWDESTGNPMEGTLKKLSLGWLLSSEDETAAKLSQTRLGEITVKKDTVIIELLGSMGINGNAAVWVNGEQVLFQEYGGYRLKSGDKVKIIQPLSGG